jgi:hypothetical protein
MQNGESEKRRRFRKRQDKRYVRKQNERKSDGFQKHFKPEGCRKRDTFEERETEKYYDKET